MTQLLDLSIKYQYVTEADYDAIKDPSWPDYQTFTMHQSVPASVYADIDNMLSSNTTFDHPSFCVLPWYGREINWSGKETHCCLLPTGYNIEKIRQKMKQGERPRECQKCWSLEDQGLISDRKLKNSALDVYTNTDIHQIMDQASTEQIKMLKLITSYTCNGACVYCNSKSSSYWNTIERRINKFIPIKTYKFVDVEVVKQKVDFSQLSMLSLIGGEPLLEKQNFDLLSNLLTVGNTQAFISIVTNGSISLTPRQIDILSQFPNLNFCISIDGQGSVFEYTRWPLKWHDIERNLDQYRTITKNISVSYTITNLNVLYHRTNTQWFKDNNLNWINNPVYHPNYFSPKVLPVTAKHKLQDHLDSKDFECFVGDPDRDPGNSWDKFLQEVLVQDQAKGIRIQDYLPEFCQLVGID